MTSPDGPAVPVAVRAGEDGFVVVSGEVDVFSAPELRACLLRCIRDGFFKLALD